MQADLLFNFISLYALDEWKPFYWGSVMYHAITKLNTLTNKNKNVTMLRVIALRFNQFVLSILFAREGLEIF